MSPKVSILVYSSCAMLIVAFVLSGSTSSAVAQHSGGKRFDCRLFCKMTGYHGMIGGCRCSFTLFTAKRSYPVGHKRSLVQLSFDGDSSSRNKILPMDVTSYYRINSPILNKTKRLSNEADEWDVMPPPAHLSSSSYVDPPYVKR